MSLRRSARIRNMGAQGPPEPQQPLATVPVRRKAPPAKAQASVKPKSMSLQPDAETQAVSNHDALSSMPPELLNMILSSINDQPTLAKLARTCKKYYAIAMPYLYKRIAVAAMFHAHIPKFIRALEPLLTIAQKKQLKEEGKYKGQQAQFSSLLDENAKPLWADCVRQMVVGVCDPGRKHEYIIGRYLEETFQNLSNLEIVETYVLTESMAESLASLKNLKALAVSTKMSGEDAMRPLAKVKNLQHLYVKDHDWACGEGKDNVVLWMLLNSRTTLRSLSLHTSSFGTCFLANWDMILENWDMIVENRDKFMVNGDEIISVSKSDEPHHLAALKSFTLSGARFDEEKFLKSMQNAIDFASLQELRLGCLGEDNHRLFQYLASLFGSAQDKPVNLRTLSVNMLHDLLEEVPEQKQVDHDAICAFVSSFDTLSTLELADYNPYPEEQTVNPGLPDTLLQAVLRHENLKVLKISYRGIISGFKIPYLSAKTVAAIVDNLPHLEEFKFAPEVTEIDQIGEALASSPNLTSVTCYPYDRWALAGQTPEEILDSNVLRGILQGFLARASCSDNDEFVWEQHYKLERVSVGSQTWIVASKFGGRKSGMAKEETMGSRGDDGRKVLYREVTESFHRYIHVGYDPHFEWVERVSKDMD